MRILTVNAGSTSLKLAVVVDGLTVATPADLDDALAGPPPDAVAHRVVHGGDRSEAAVVDDALIAELAALSELAPLHQPPALTALARCRSTWPTVPNVAAFDTAFHASIPAAARTYALPGRLRAKVRAYGFHGLSHAWSTRVVGRRAPEARRIVVAHLGGGQSLCAVEDGLSVATTMGFTPLDGLVMATRPGSIDPGAVLWLAEHTAEDLSVVLEGESGLLGLCGTADLREVRRRAASRDEPATFALDVWRHRLVTHLGSCVAALRGIDAVAFTGGIGEHDPATRADVASAFSWLGLDIDEGRDDGDGLVREITATGAPVRSFVITAREDLQLAAEAERRLPEMGAVPPARTR